MQYASYNSNIDVLIKKIETLNESKSREQNLFFRGLYNHIKDSVKVGEEHGFMFKIVTNNKFDDVWVKRSILKHKLLEHCLYARNRWHHLDIKVTAHTYRTISLKLYREATYWTGTPFGTQWDQHEDISIEGTASLVLIDKLLAYNENNIETTDYLNYH